MKAIVLCAGMGTRLGKLTQNTPKPLLEIKGMPILGHLLKLLACNNFKQIAINTHFQAEQIRNYAGDGSSFGVEITYFHEAVLLGTAGALSGMKEFTKGSEFVLVIYGDLYIQEDLHRLVDKHKKNNADITLLLHRRKKSNSIVEMNEDGRITALLERPPEEIWKDIDEVWVNSGVYIVSEKVAASIKENQFADFPRDIFPELIKSGSAIYGVPLVGQRIAIDSPQRLNEAKILPQLEEVIKAAKMNFK